MVMETEAPDISVNALAKRYGVVRGLLFRWRAQLGRGKPKPARFARVRLAEGPRGGDVDRLALQALLPIPDGAVAVDLPDGRRVFVPRAAIRTPCAGSSPSGF
jgi:transposase-like protein